MEENNSSLKIYPNPSNGIFTLETGNNFRQQVAVYNLLGEKIYETEITDASITVTLPVKSGVYFCELRDEGNYILRKKIVVE